MINVRNRISLAGFVVILAAAVPVNLGFLRAVPEMEPVPSSFTAVVKGHAAEALNRAFDKSFPLRDFAIDTYGAISYFMFGEARRGAVVGSEGWLYSVEEFETDGGSKPRLEAALDRIAATGKELAAKGIPLTVVPLPLKADIYAEHLGRHRLPAEPAERYQAVLDGLAKRGVATVDVRPSLVAAKASSQLFLRTDTHWTVDGAKVVASAIAKGVHVEGDKLDTNVVETPETIEGDLLKFVRLGALAHRGPHADAVKVASIKADGGGGLFDEPGQDPVALVGTSYSADDRWGFAGHLQVDLGVGVKNWAMKGEGPMKPMAQFMDKVRSGEAAPKAVVWEIPIRYLDDK